MGHRESETDSDCLYDIVLPTIADSWREQPRSQAETGTVTTCDLVGVCSLPDSLEPHRLEWKRIQLSPIINHLVSSGW
jgi:hypothetical protein